MRLQQPTSFNDPVALQTDWSPLAPGGSNFRTHRLQEDGGAFTFKRTLGMNAFASVFVVTGVGLSAAGLTSGHWFLTLFGVPFAAIGVYLFWPKPLVFDGSANQCRLGGRVTSYSEIHAIQIVPEPLTGDESPDWHSYELNLVLRDGTRLNVVDHSKVDVIRSEAQLLSAHLGCKVWDATKT